MALALAVYSLYGLDGKLRRDHANCMYAGQRAAAGVPPYVSMFTMVAPLPQLLAALGVRLAEGLEADDLRTTRVLFLVIGALTAAVVYLLGRSVLGSEAGGALAALAFISCGSFAHAAAAGPQKKVPMVLFEVLSLWLTMTHRWFLAGVAGGLSLLCWQPMLVFPVVTIVVAAARGGSASAAPVRRAALGFGLPLALTAFYFHWHGALWPLIEGTVLFPLRYLSRPPRPLAHRLMHPLRVMLMRNGIAGVPILGGLLGCASFYRGLQPARPLWQALVRDRRAPILLSLPAVLVWSTIDFQGVPDQFVILPYCALGLGTLGAFAARRAAGLAGHGRHALARPLAVGAAGGALVLLAVGNTAHDRESGLLAQRAAVAEMEQRLGRDAKLLSIGAPEALVLLQRENPNRYPVLIHGIDRYVAAHTAGGFDGWIRELEAFSPDVIAVGATTGPNAPQLLGWVRRGYEPMPTSSGAMRFFVKPTARPGEGFSPCLGSPAGSRSGRSH